MVNIAIFASGSGSNAERIIQFYEKSNAVTISLIVCNKKDAYVFERAKKLQVEAVYLSKNQINDADVLVPILNEKKVDMIVLAGFLLLVPAYLIEAYTNRIINIHPALLPKYGGKGMYGMHVHEAVVAHHEKETGITVHYVNEKYDEGAVILQAHCQLNESDTAESVANKIHALEYRYFPVAIGQVLEDQFGLKA